MGNLEKPSENVVGSVSFAFLCHPFRPLKGRRDSKVYFWAEPTENAKKTLDKLRNMWYIIPATTKFTSTHSAYVHSISDTHCDGRP